MGSPTLMNTAGLNIDLHNNNSEISLLQSQKGFFLLKAKANLKVFPFHCRHVLALGGHLIGCNVHVFFTLQLN